MIVYLETTKTFLEDVFTNRIDEIIKAAVKAKIGINVSRSELLSWKNSLECMQRVMADSKLPSNAGIAIEYSIPNTSKRIDFIVSGYNSANERTIVIVELKQWSEVQGTTKDAIVSTYLGGAEREVAHPSYQAWSYAALLEDYNEAVRREPISLKPCAYLHNCDRPEVILSKHYKPYIDDAPAFLRDDAQKLRDFIRKHVRKGDSGEALYVLSKGKIVPSKGLVDHLSSLIKGNAEFNLIDEQKVVYEAALDAAAPLNGARKRKKKVVIVNGGPGTGKSVVAINLLVATTTKRQVSKYVTKNGAPRAVYQALLTGSMTKSRISNMFVGSGGFTNVEENTFDTLIVDEAHRLNEKSGLYSNLGENQIKEIIHSAKTSVFFLDEDQRIHWLDIGSREEIIHWAREHRADIVEMKLESQFRCAGSDGYIAWLDNLLQIRPNANVSKSDSRYTFEVANGALDLRTRIVALNKKNNSARMVAGYCWDWKSKKEASKFDIVLDDGLFKAKWNLSKEGSLWIMSKTSVSEVGCIHTCQGLELDHIGVIIGPDLVVRNGKIITDATKRSSNDNSMRGYKSLFKQDPKAAIKKADLLIKNTYRTLMSRGRISCTVYSEDEETREWLTSSH
ncbi:MAG: DUF2075 domain-containing protein [Ignavibacteria bacterium]|nr:DUF2075 domain-containing protein [Ignavibacteria bacterium]